MFVVSYGGLFGTTSFAPSPSGSSDTLDLLYDMIFAATAATIMSGAVAECFPFLHCLVGAVVITAVIYPIHGS